MRAATSLLRRRTVASVCSASRASTVSSAPLASPARTMFTYRSSKTSPCGFMASARVEPSFTLSRTSARMTRSLGLSTWSIMAVRASTMGMLAPTRVLSCWVIVAMSCTLMRSKYLLKST